MCIYTQQVITIRNNLRYKDAYVISLSHIWWICDVHIYIIIIVTIIIYILFYSSSPTMVEILPLLVITHDHQQVPISNGRFVEGSVVDLTGFNLSKQQKFQPLMFLWKKTTQFLMASLVFTKIICFMRLIMVNNYIYIYIPLRSQCYNMLQPSTASTIGILPWPPGARRRAPRVQIDTGLQPYMSQSYESRTSFQWHQSEAWVQIRPKSMVQY